MEVGETVIVIDNSNYWEGFREPCPFKARIIGFYESGILVLRTFNCLQRNWLRLDF